MNSRTTIHKYQFLKNAGEMGELILNYNWDNSVIGPIENWPQSLRTTLGIILNSKFPMFVWWGKDLISFYNNAYKEILGNDGKHPKILGLKAEESWEEIWDIIKPLIDNVMENGEATWSEDQLIPIFRNGKIEDVYWTFSYSPIYDEFECIAGVLVTCTDTTEKVNNFKKLQKNNSKYLNNIMQAPIAMGVLTGENKIIEIANDLMLELWGKTSKDAIGFPFFDAVPEAKNQGLEELFDNVYKTGVRFDAKERFIKLSRNGVLQDFYLDFVYDAIRNENDEINGILVIANDVTNQVKTRNKIELAEERLRIAADATGFATWDLDVKSRTLFHSPKLAEIFGHHPDEKFNQESLRNQILPEDKIKFVDVAFKEALESGTYNYQARILTPKGKIVWVETKGKVLYNDKKEPIKIIGTLRDISEEIKLQKILAENEQKFRLLADSMPQHIWTSDTEGNLNYFNKSVFDYSGLTLTQIEKEGWIQIVHPDDRPKNIELWMNAIATGQDFLYEHRFRRYDGVYRWQLSRAIPQKDAYGKIKMWVGTSTDIEDQKTFAYNLEEQVKIRTLELEKLNDALKKSEAQYHLMVEQVQDYAILFLNKDGLIENWNNGAEKIKGYIASEIIGKSFSVFYTPEDRENNIPYYLLEKARKNRIASQEGWRVKKDGTCFWAHVVITAIHNQKNEVIGFSKVTHDLTDKKAAADELKHRAEQLIQKNKDLEKMNDELKSFAYVSSHDLQEPLRKIQAFATRILVKEIHNLSETGQDYFRRMNNAANRMQLLIEDLLTYSRTNSTDYVFEKVSLYEILGDVQSEMKETIIEKHAKIEIGKLCELKIIPFQFRQLMSNLINNAIKFAIKGKAPEIYINSQPGLGKEFQMERLEPEKKYCNITISDNGIGFEEKYKERIFEVFQRLHGKEEYSGTGIGLAIVKKIVENHYGFIKAESEPNKGATFQIFIPILEE